MISNFINLSSYCVLEFRATPIGDANPPLLTSDFFLVDNKHLGIKQIYNTDEYSATTRNTRSFSLIGLGGSKLIYNDISLDPMYSEFDPLITETTVSSELSISMVMDTMRFHFASGFNFTDVEHIIVGARHKLNNITQIQLANIILNAVTTAALFSYNTRPLFLANTIYDKYIDIKIPSIPWLDADFTQFGASSFEHAITSGIGFIKNAPITVFLAEATKSNYYASNNITYEQYQITQYYEGSVSQINKFDTLGCQIAEAEDGDYIEFFATWNGAFPDSLIATLNESGADQDWIISHQLTVYEHIGSDIILTGNSLIYQESNFDTPLSYRPILKQAGFAVAMSIDYIMRLINKKNGDQIIKSASMSLINPNRYGKKLEKIELLNGPQSMRIYNKIEQKNFESNGIFSGSVPSTSTSAPGTDDLAAEIVRLGTVITELEELNRVTAISTNAIIKQANIHLTGGNALHANGSQAIYGQGRAILVIDPVDNLIQLILFVKQNIGPGLLSIPRLNLVNGYAEATFKLIFGTTNDFIFSNTTLDTVGIELQQQNLANGELLFRIPKVQAKLLLENSENTFMLTKVDPTGIETLMYSGTWLSSSDYAAANAAGDIATENAITAAALATALATINTLTLANSQLTTQKETLASQKRTLAAERNTAVTNLATHLALPHYTAQQQSLLPIVNTGGGGTSGTAGSSGTSGTALVPVILSFSPASGVIGSTAEIIGTFDYVNSGAIIKVGNQPAGIISVNQAQGRILFAIPNGVNSGTGNSSSAPNLITYTSLGGSSTSATPFNVTEPANANINLHVHVYVGTRTAVSGVAGAYTYSNWETGNNNSGIFEYDSLTIFTNEVSSATVAKVHIRMTRYGQPITPDLSAVKKFGAGANSNNQTRYIDALTYNDGWVDGIVVIPKSSILTISRLTTSLNAGLAFMSTSIWLNNTRVHNKLHSGDNQAFTTIAGYRAYDQYTEPMFTSDQLSGQTIHIWSGPKNLL